MITVKFSCEACGLENVEVGVPPRNSPNIDIVRYVERTIGKRVGAKHAELSPHCRATKMSKLFIPLPDESDPSPWIGKEPSSPPAPPQGEPPQ